MKFLLITLVILNCSLVVGQPRMNAREAIFYSMAANEFQNSDLATWSGNNYTWLGYYCQLYDQVNFRNALNDEFKKGPYLQRQSDNLTNEINAVDFTKKFSLTTTLKFKEYDFTTNCFTIDPNDLHYNLVRTNLAYSDLGGLQFDVGEIDDFNDFQLALKMDRVAAERFINSRKDNSGNINRTIDVKIIYNVVKRKLASGRSMKTIYLALNAQKILFMDGSVVLKEFIPSASKTVTFELDGNKTVTDIDGNIYHKILIGNQVWLLENLKTTKYRNGDLIGTTTKLNISSQILPKFQWAYEDEESNVSTYGRLYTWDAATDSRNICPNGWHIPTKSEWETLVHFIGGQPGGKLKEAGIRHWGNPNDGATNSSGFTALPGGFRFTNGQFSFIGSRGYWWSSTEYGTNGAWYMEMNKDNSNGSVSPDDNKTYGYSVRCIQDIGSSAIGIEKPESKVEVTTLSDIQIERQVEKPKDIIINKPISDQQSNLNTEQKLDLPFVGTKGFETRPGVSGSGTPQRYIEIKQNGDVFFGFIQVNRSDGSETKERYYAGKFNTYMKCLFEKWDNELRYYKITKEKIFEVDKSNKQLTGMDCCGLQNSDLGDKCPCEGKYY